MIWTSLLTDCHRFYLKYCVKARGQQWIWWRVAFLPFNLMSLKSEVLKTSVRQVNYIALNMGEVLFRYNRVLGLIVRVGNGHAGIRAGQHVFLVEVLCHKCIRCVTVWVLWKIINANEKWCHCGSRERRFSQRDPMWHLSKRCGF